MAMPSNRRADSPHAAPSGSHASLTRNRVAAIVPAGARLLDLGGSDSLASELTSRGCRVVGLAPEGVDTPDLLEASKGLQSERFETIIAVDRLGRVRDPEAYLAAIRTMIAPRGRLIVTVPNASHERVQEALAAGGSPYEVGVLDRDQLRLFTRDSLIAAIESAGFAVGRVEGLDHDGENPSTREPGSETLAHSWLAEAHALPAEDLAWVQMRIRESASECEAARIWAFDLESLHAETLTMLDAAHRRADRLNQQLESTRTLLQEAHQQLFARDEEYRASTRNLIDATDASEAGRVAHREAIEAWHARSEAEYQESKQVLVSERDAACHHALAAEARCRMLELRFEHILMEVPRRLARRVMQKIRRRGS